MKLLAFQGYKHNPSICIKTLELEGYLWVKGKWAKGWELRGKIKRENTCREQ